MKILDSAGIAFINDVLKSRDGISVTLEISAHPDNEIAIGKIEINTVKGLLQFNIAVSPDFPLGKIEFICTSHKGYPHMMHYGTICLNAAPAISIKDRLELELDKLDGWVKKYFINEEEDKHFDYYFFPRQRNIQVIFEEDSVKELIKHQQGKFSYSSLNSFKVGDHNLETWVALDIGGRKCRWSETFYKRFDKKYTGLWIKLVNPPVVSRRQRIEDWKDLLNLMTAEQSRFLYKEYLSLTKLSAYSNSFLFTIGYEIMGEIKSEIHWDTILIHFDNFPFAPLKIKQGVYVPEDLGNKVDWCKSSNASYNRIFGRGRLSNSITDKKVLIIGTGAVGSTLFHSLVRGGCRNIEISEYDDIEPGNICRGQFSFSQAGKPKLTELYNAGLAISPYLDLNISFGIHAIDKDNKGYRELKSKLQKFDFILDCSTDKYLSIMLDGMQLSGRIINFSISNEANHMAIITGVGNIHKLKSNLYDRISPEKSEPFFVATGCWHPTFKASFTDINVLLMYAINEINLVKA